tara:strand:- start:409 stop:1014 length:606 start_codon:yes stop_codon:yes gene_type:complete
MKKKLAGFIGSLFAKRQYKNMVKEIYFENPKKILDVGGSSGILAKKIKKELGDVDYSVLEINREAIKIGKKNNPGIKFILGNAENMPFKNKEFDLVICKDVLHHCSNPKKVINEIKRVSGDYIIIEARRGDKWLDYYLSGHNHFTFAGFKNLVKPEEIYFLDLLWPGLRLMPIFLILPKIPKSKNAFMVGTSYKLTSPRGR